jgi:hypothetical protein
MMRRPRPHQPISEGEIVDNTPAPLRADDGRLSDASAQADVDETADRVSSASARAPVEAMAKASLALAPRRESALYGTRAFFRRAAEELLVSTRHGLELAGAAYARETEDGRTVLVGLVRKGTGKPGRVALSSSWGQILWHTHPGLRGSLAAFSDEDLKAAAASERPLLVIGFGGLSPDVVTTLTLPFGLKGFLVSSGVKGLLALEKTGKLESRLLRLGVAARVCYPTGHIDKVARLRASPLVHALDDMSFIIDKSVGAVERTGQRALKKVLDRARGGGG